MGEYNAVQESGFNRLLSSRMNTDASSPAGTLAPEIIPVFEVDADPLVRPEHCYQRGEKLGAAGGEVVAAATNAFFCINNLGNSQQLVIVEGFECVCSAAGRVFVTLQFTGTGLGSTFAALVSRDTRWGKSASQRGRPRSTVGMGTGAPLAATNIIAELDALTTNLRVAYDGPVILAPGAILAVFAETAGVDIRTFAIRWRERPLLPSELD